MAFEQSAHMIILQVVSQMLVLFLLWPCFDLYFPFQGMGCLGQGDIRRLGKEQGSHIREPGTEEISLPVRGLHHLSLLKSE
jgi:hypothetical protein